MTVPGMPPGDPTVAPDTAPRRIAERYQVLRMLGASATLYIVQEFIDGRSLLQRMEWGPVLSQKESRARQSFPARRRKRRRSVPRALPSLVPAANHGS